VYAPVPGMTANLEEARAVADGSVYTRQIDHNGTYLLKPLDMHEIVRGRKISFKLPFNVGGCKKPSGATAELFFERGWNVVASMRTPEKSKAVGRKDPRWLASPAGCDRRRLGLRGAAGGTGT